MKERLVGGVLAADEDCCSTMAACAMSAFTSPGLCTARHPVRKKEGGRHREERERPRLLECTPLVQILAEGLASLCVNVLMCTLKGVEKQVEYACSGSHLSEKSMVLDWLPMRPYIWMYSFAICIPPAAKAGRAMR
jgi:hypothetical protein